MGRGRGSFVLTGAGGLGSFARELVRWCFVGAVRPRKGRGGESVRVGDGGDRCNDHEGSDGGRRDARQSLTGGAHGSSVLQKTD